MSPAHVTAKAAPRGGVKIDSITYSYPTTRKREEAAIVALQDVSLEVEPQQIVCLVGRSGCGKSTLLKIIAGLIAPTSGRVFADSGKPVLGVSSDRLLVFQRPAVFPWLTVRENIRFGLRRVNAIQIDSWEDCITEMLRVVGLNGFENHYPYQLSGGMLQRVQLARCLVCRPTMLLLDEPFGALDAQTRFSMQELLLAVWEKEKPTIIFVTHDVEEALFLADRVVVMTPRPGTVSRSFQAPWPRPRTLETLAIPEFQEMKNDLLAFLRAA